ncbi:MAG TPA: phosphatidate cytidylyltransferase [Actinomycetota bacterium]|nr:phosphatidate cytidylyltransferase [Actinomycetota bacterium]
MPPPAQEPSPPPSGTVPGRSLRQAVITALVLLALIVVCAIGGRRWFFVLAATVVIMAMFELLDALVQKGRRPSIPLGLAGVLAILVAAYQEKFAFIAIVLAVATYAALVFALRPSRGTTPASDSAWTIFGLAWIGGGGAGAVSILVMGGGLPLLIASILIVACDDIGAYFAGTRFGRHKMAPSISPAKSWEGFAGGIATALAAGLLFASLLDEMTVTTGLALGAIAGLLAPVGDLVESQVKRELGIKDSGRLLPGHGGMLDRLDAIIFCCPALSLYLHFVA